MKDQQWIGCIGMLGPANAKRSLDVNGHQWNDQRNAGRGRISPYDAAVKCCEITKLQLMKDPGYVCDAMARISSLKMFSSPGTILQQLSSMEIRLVWISEKLVSLKPIEVAEVQD